MTGSAPMRAKRTNDPLDPERRRAREYAARSAGMKNRLRDPATGALVSYVGQPVRRARDPQTGRFVNAGPKPGAEPKPIPVPDAAAVAELVARYPIRFTTDDPHFETDAQRVLDVLATRLVALDVRNVQQAARDSERLHEASSLVSGNVRPMIGGHPIRATNSNDPLTRERYDGALTLILYSDSTTTIRSLLALSRELVRSRLRLRVE
jgi:hypothetical protein